MGTFNFDLSNIQIAGVERPSKETAALGALTSFTLSNDGVLTGVFSDGSVRPLYQLALATCAAPDKMTEKSGGFYIPTADSGELRVGVSGENGFGTIVSRALEDSTTDISKELAEAIKTQAAYAANAKVIGTISEMLDTLMRM
jgi:flagellar hook protein FlgE